jgi:hypothetical protein
VTQGLTGIDLQTETPVVTTQKAQHLPVRIFQLQSLALRLGAQRFL